MRGAFSAEDRSSDVLISPRSHNLGETIAPWRLEYLDTENTEILKRTRATIVLTEKRLGGSG